jgi:hypothetical protein
MSIGEGLVHVGRGVKADRVRATTIKALVFGGPLLQNTLINEVAKEVAKDLEDIDVNTVNGLVRKFLEKQKGELVEVRVDEKHHRKYWEITPTGLQQAFNKNLVNLHEFAKAYVRITPEGPEWRPICYKALARSKALSEKVDADLKKTEGQMLEDVSFIKQLSRVPINFIWEIGLTAFHSVVYYLANDKDLRKQVGPEITAELCVSARTLAESYEANIKEMRKVANDLQSVQEASLQG